MIICSVKEAMPNGNVKKGEVVRCVIVRVKKEVRRADAPTSASIRTPPCSSTTTALRAHPYLRPVARELRDKKYMKIVSLAPETL